MRELCVQQLGFRVLENRKNIFLVLTVSMNTEDKIQIGQYI